MRLVLAIVAALTASPVLAFEPTITVSQDSAIAFGFFPKESLKALESGLVNFNVAVDKRGRLNACQVVGSSGFARLDAASCQLLAFSARFTPLRRADGSPTAGLRTGTILWVLPGQDPNMAMVRRTAAKVPDASEAVLCRRAIKTGSLMIENAVCLTAREWALQANDSSDLVHEMTSPKG